MNSIGEQNDSEIQSEDNFRFDYLDAVHSSPLIQKNMDGNNVSNKK